MLSLRLFTACAIAGAVVSLLPAEDKKPGAKDDGFKPLFNGKDLAGWVNVNCHPDTFFVKDNTIITTGTPTGFLRTDKQYENFVMEFDWMHVEKEKMANSGLFVWGDPIPATGTPYTRGIEVQVLINFAPKDGWATSHGDIFSIHGARCTPDRPHPTRKGLERCLPSENRVKGGGEWNHYKVTANDGAIKLEVNGKEVSGVSKCTPRKGYMALESEGAECHFKNIKVKELPSTNPKPEEVAQVWNGQTSLFNGIDLKGWKETAPLKQFEWQVSGGKLISKTGCGPIVSDRKAAHGELTYDWKANGKFSMTTASIGPVAFGVTAEGDIACEWNDKTANKPVPGKSKGTNPKGWNRVVASFDGETVVISINGVEGLRTKVTDVKKSDTISVMGRHGDVEIMNVFFRELKKG